MQRCFALPLLLALSLFSPGSLAQIMDFETFPDDAECFDNAAGVVENGLSLVDDTPIPAFDPDSCAVGVNSSPDFPQPGNGSNIFAWCGACDQLITLTLTRQDGTPFNLESVDFNRFPDSPSPATVNITGFPVGGAPVTVQHTITSDAWVTVNFDNRFNNLSRVEIVNESFPGIDRVLDNIVTASGEAASGPRAVPMMTPFGLLLVAAGLLLAAGGALRRQ